MDIYQPLKTHFHNDKRVSINEGKGAQGIKMCIKGKEKMFAMFLKGDLLILTCPERVNALINQKSGVPYDPGTGKTMRDRVLIPARNQAQWIDLIEQTIQAHQVSE
ncbi:hypothetical protein [Reinekea sp. G2M2-21]|uniref:hypothetical protein n=1 Tax=Reinekea sp. G2M2-21 TaxID=2788942 RepID=UPI0018AAE92E|nr:hypothetical protein [Reinekea sp. G2M2-21]